MCNNGRMSESDFQIAIEQFYGVSAKLRDEWQKEDIPPECRMCGKYLKRRTRKWMKVSSSWKKRSVAMDSDEQKTTKEVEGIDDEGNKETEDVRQLEDWTEDAAEQKEEEKEEAERIYCQLEHNILYSRSYSVPVIYFNVFLPSGELLTLEDLWENSFAQLPNKEDNSWAFITQQEHPLLRRPFFHFHPCHTADLMKEVQRMQSSMSPGVYLLSWLSSVAPLVHLDLSFAYGQEIVDEPAEHSIGQTGHPIGQTGHPIGQTGHPIGQTGHLVASSTSSSVFLSE